MQAGSRGFRSRKLSLQEVFQMSENTTAKKTGVDKLIDGIEKVCNKLPPPAILFCWLFLITAIIGCIFSVMGVALTNPASGEVVTSANLFSKDGVDWILGNMVKNFTGFAPLGLVITMTLGIGLCEESGMLISMLNSSLKNVPAAMIPYVIALLVPLVTSLPIPQWLLSRRWLPSFTWA